MWIKFKLFSWFSKQFWSNLPNTFHSLFCQKFSNYTACIKYFCVRLYRAMWKLSGFEVLCKLFSIILVHSTDGTVYTVFSCHVLISSPFIIFIWVYVSLQFLFTELCPFSSTNYCALFIAWQVKCFVFSPPPSPQI
jgi:hypothetical protein